MTDDNSETKIIDMLTEKATTLEKHDTVNSPSHYTMGLIEVIDAIEDWQLNYHRGNVVKYVARAGRKDPKKEIEDLCKARWYLEREINRLTND